MAVPGMAMDQVGIDVRRIEISAATDSPENGTERFWAIKRIGVQLETPHPQIPVFRILIAEAANFDRHQLRQLTRQIIHMHPRPP
jgi:hypothetical protein